MDVQVSHVLSHRSFCRSAKIEAIIMTLLYFTKQLSVNELVNNVNSYRNNNNGEYTEFCMQYIIEKENNLFEWSRKKGRRKKPDNNNLWNQGFLTTNICWLHHLAITTEISLPTLILKQIQKIKAIFLSKGLHSLLRKQKFCWAVCY